jgi:hypothetical protein
MQHNAPGVSHLQCDVSQGRTLKGMLSSAICTVRVLNLLFNNALLLLLHCCTTGGRSREVEWNNKAIVKQDTTSTEVPIQPQSSWINSVGISGFTALSLCCVKRQSNGTLQVNGVISTLSPNCCFDDHRDLLMERDMRCQEGECIQTAYLIVFLPAE